MATRIKYLDIAKGLALLLMVIGHCPHLGKFGHSIFIFHMPLFFVASGLLLSFDQEYDIRRKAKKILLPYLIVFALSIIPYYCFYGDLNILWIYPLMKTRTLFGNDLAFGIGPVWFLPCYFFCNYWITRGRKLMSYNALLCVFLVLFVFFYLLSERVKGLPFLLFQTALGSLFMLIGHKCKEHNYLKSPWVWAVGLASTWLCFKYGQLSMYSVVCKLLFLQVIAGVFCSLLIFEGAKLIKSFSLLEWISRNSLTILCIHSFDWSLGISVRCLNLMNISTDYKFIAFCLFIALGMLCVRGCKQLCAAIAS